MMCLSVEEWGKEISFSADSAGASVHEEINQHQYERGDTEYPGEKIFTHGLLLVPE